MILYYQTPWKNTLTFRISFDLRDLNIHQTHPALLHFAEHLMFIATKKYNEQTLYERKTFFFDFLGAYTTPFCLSINVTCTQTDFKKVQETLREMIYSWQCTPKQFIAEKQEILAELKSFDSEATTRAVNTLSAKDPEFKTIAIGNKKTLEALTYSDIKKIKEAWKIMLTQAPVSIIVASGSITAREKKLLETLVDRKKTAQVVAPNPFSARLLTVAGTHALQFKTINSSPFYTLLDRLYFVRHTFTNPDCYLEFVHEKNSLSYFAFQKPGKTFSFAAGKKFLLTPPTKIEFNVAKDIIIKQLGSLQDATNPQELIDWLETYSQIPETKNQSLAEISKLFAAYSFKNFSKEWKEKCTNIV